MSHPSPRPRSTRRHPRAVAVGASIVAVLATVASIVLMPAAGAQGGEARTAADRAELRERASAHRRLAAAAKRTPAARGTRCPRTGTVPGQGRSCRTADGLYLVPQRDGTPLVTHGPDIVSGARATGKAGGFGTPSSIVCSPASRSRHVALLYLLPSDFASGNPQVHGDRSAEVAEQMRQALYDASAVVDGRAGELAAGARRRLRVLCDDDGRPSVERVVLPRTANEYLAPDGGFSMLGDDLARLGHLPEYDGYVEGRVPAVRRVLAYYDADFHDGYAGQGTMFRRSSLIRQGLPASDPLISRSTRNINNNPPSASFAVQYGTRDSDGIPDPPLYTSLLHELAHTMGAVQDEPPTSSDAGHCVDGLDLMCYFDGPGSTYVETACPDAQAPIEPADERFDCNGDTYFHPAPPPGTPLASGATWHLGLPANETMATGTAAPPAVVENLRVSGSGTRRVLRWDRVEGATGYEVAWRRPDADWEYQFTTAPTTTPLLLPRTDYELRVGAVGRDLTRGPRAAAQVRTGVVDNTPPLAATGVEPSHLSSTLARLRFVLPADNVRVTRIRVERRSGRRWVQHVLLPAPAPRVAGPGDTVTTPYIRGLRPRTTYLLRLRALDARGNLGAPSAQVRLRTR